MLENVSTKAAKGDKISDNLRPFKADSEIQARTFATAV
jgi:hypothetical protein